MLRAVALSFISLCRHDLLLADADGPRIWMQVYCLGREFAGGNSAGLWVSLGTDRVPTVSTICSLKGVWQQPQPQPGRWVPQRPNVRLLFPSSLHIAGPGKVTLTLEAERINTCTILQCAKCFLPYAPISSCRDPVRLLFNGPALQRGWVISPRSHSWQAIDLRFKPSF